MGTLNSVRSRLSKSLQSPVIRGTLWKIAARISSLFLQSAYFLIIARSLGTEQYGLFVGTMALVKITVPFSTWGSTHILVKHVSRDRSLLQAYFGNALWITLALGSTLIVSLLILNQFVLPAHFPWLLLLSIGLAELIFARFHDAALKAFLSTDLFGLDAQLNILLSISGLGAASCLLFLDQSATAMTWGLLYLVSRLVTAFIGIWLVSRHLGRPKPQLGLMKSEIKDGFYFSVDLSSQTIYNDIDKTMLASMSTLSATGIYGAAYRIIEVGLIPVGALLGACYAQFFRSGAKGIAGSLSFARKIVPTAATYGAIASLALWVCAPIVPLVLGESYIDAVSALRWLSPLIFLKSVQFFAADTLTGAGLQGWRSSLQAGIAIFNALLNLWLIPLYSWQGAAFSTLISDSLLAVILWVLIYIFHQKQIRQSDG